MIATREAELVGITIETKFLKKAQFKSSPSGSPYKLNG